MNTHSLPSSVAHAPVAGMRAAENHGWLALALALLNPLLIGGAVLASLLSATFWGHGLIAAALFCVVLNLSLLPSLRRCRHLARSNVILAGAVAASAAIVLAQSSHGFDLVQPETMVTLFLLVALVGGVRAFGVGLKSICAGPWHWPERLVRAALLLVITGSAALQGGAAAFAAYGLGRDGFTNSKLLVWLGEKTPFRLEERTFARLLMQDEYLWRDLVDAAKADDAKDAGEVIERLMSNSTDHWSGVIPLAEAEELDLGLARDYGFIEDAEGHEQLVIAYVVPGSSASNAGLVRGERIFSSAGEVVTRANRRQLLAGQGDDQLKIAVGDPDASLRQVELARGLIKNPALLPPKVLTGNGRRIGYLFLRTFDTPFNLELRPALEQLKAARIDELVLDLRYNGGGYEEDAIRLGAAIAGDAVNGKVALNETMNSRYAHLKQSVLFEVDPSIALDLKRLVVITGKETCSASEALIAMLRPYIDVTLVGGRTCGKPFSMLVRNYGGQSFNVITFALTNAEGWGGYLQGIEPDCPARDDLGHELGDPEEANLKLALRVLESGAAGGSGSRRCPT